MCWRSCRRTFRSWVRGVKTSFNMPKSWEQARFRTRSGLLIADQVDDRIELDLPAEPPQLVQVPHSVIDALGVSPKYAGKGRLNYLIEVETEDVVRALSPDFAALSKLPPAGYIVTSEASSSGYDFVSRFFVPTAGINEDPVTGSAHCCLGPYWMERLGKDTFVAYQASARGGVVYVRVEGDRVHVGGHAVTVIRGELHNAGAATVEPGRGADLTSRQPQAG